MKKKAYLVISIDKEYFQYHYKDVLRDLEPIREVVSVEQIKGTSDILVEVHTEMRVIFVAHKIMVKNWCKHLKIMRVVPFRDVELKGVNINSLITTRSFILA